MGLLSGLGKLAGGLFGASQADDIPKFTFNPDIRTPSFRLNASPGGNVDLTRVGSPQRFPGVLSKLSALGGEVRPGFGRFTDAAVESIRRAKGDALGNAREQLSRRRVLGSGFANAQEAQIARAFGRDEATLRGKALLAEIDATFKIIDQEFRVKNANITAELSELQIATGLATATQAVLSDQAKFDKSIAVRAAEGTGDFFASVGEDIFGGFGDIFSGGADFSGGGGGGLGSGSVRGDPLFGGGF